MIAELLCRNLYAWSLQMAILIAAGGLLCLALRFGPPRARLIFWHVLLAACLLLPALPVRRLVGAPRAGTASGQISIVVLPDTSPVPDRFVSQTILLLLAAGAALRLGWLLLGSRQLHRYRRRAEPLLPVPDSIREASLELATAGDFYLSSDVASPVTFGFRHQTVLLPPGFFELTRDAQRAILCHELLHLRRNDWVFVIAEELIRALFWFHPAIWWLLAQIQLTREQAVDHAVIRHTRDRDQYVDALLGMALTQVRADLAPAPLFLRKRQLARRVASLVRGANMSKRRFIASLATMASVLAMTAVLALWQFPLTAAQDTTSGASNNKEAPPKLIKDVAPVYPPEAKAAGIQGTVVLAITIDTNGRVENVEPVSGPEMLRQPAIDAVRDWIFEPKIVKGEAVPVKSDISVNFVLDKPVKKPAGTPLGEGVVPPKLITHVPPAYPEDAKAAKIQGEVILKIVIGKTGRVESAEFVSGPDALRQAAIDAVMAWEFQPATKDGEPVSLESTVSVNFQLK
jgi:TonB family protein